MCACRHRKAGLQPIFHTIQSSTASSHAGQWERSCNKRYLLESSPTKNALTTSICQSDDTTVLTSLSGDELALLEAKTSHVAIQKEVVVALQAEQIKLLHGLLRSLEDKGYAETRLSTLLYQLNHDIVSPLHNAG